MAFDFIKFVTKNKSTLGSRLSTKKKGLIKEEFEFNEAKDEEEDAEEEEDNWNKPDEFDTDEFDKEPSKKDVKAADSSTKGQYDKRSKLANLVKQKDELVAQLKSGKINIDQYKQMIGTIPQQIKTLTADMSSMTDLGDEEEEL